MMKYEVSRADELRRKLDLGDEPTRPQGEKVLRNSGEVLCGGTRLFADFQNFNRKLYVLCWTRCGNQKRLRTFFRNFAPSLVERRGRKGIQDAGVLILLHDDGTSDVKVLLCVRNKELRRHPGEVCFPGGMMDEEDGGDVRKTAIREAYEEVGVREADDYLVLGSLPAFRARFGILIHPTVALVTRAPKFELSVDEVDSIFWISLSRFLEDSVHSTFPVDEFYFVHVFTFEDAPTTYGVTALMCIVVAIGILDRLPEFSLLANLTIEDMLNRHLDSLEIIRHVYEYASRKFEQSKL